MKPDLKALEELVSVEKIRAKKFDAPVPVSVSVHPKVDHSGDDALEVVVVFPEKTPDSVFLSGQANKILYWINDVLSAATEWELFPYVTFRLENEVLV